MLNTLMDLFNMATILLLGLVCAIRLLVWLADPD